MTSIDIVSVTDRKQWNDFFAIKRILYRDDPAAVIPLRSMEQLQLDTGAHPFYQHARRTAFLAIRSGEVVGRIAAIKDDLHNEYYTGPDQIDRTGFFGFFECVDDTDVARELIDAAGQWLREEGCDTIRGPVNPSMKSDFGVLVEGHSVPPFLMMGHTPLYYDRLLKGCGLEVAKQFFTFSFDAETDAGNAAQQWDKLDVFEQRIKTRHPMLKFRDMTGDNFAQTMRDINHLGNQVRAANYGFVPLTDAELEFMISQLKRIIRHDMIHAAYRGDRLVGFIVNVPDLNWALRKTVGSADWIRMPQLLYWIRRTPRTRVIALGVDEEFRNKGVAMLLIKRLTDVYYAYKDWEFSWVVEDNLKSIRAIGRAVPLRQEKVYRIYEGPVK